MLACQQRSADITIISLRYGYSNAVDTKQPKIDPKIQKYTRPNTQVHNRQLDEVSDREEKERLRDLDNNVPRAA
jgi:hypothetical protein